jgi:hypothetical protein
MTSGAAALLLLGTSSVGAAPSSPVASYWFDAGTGSVLTDSSGNGNDGTIPGATWTTAGRNGGALTFDGVNDLVTIADKSFLDLTTGMTLEAWARPAALGKWRTLRFKESRARTTEPRAPLRQRRTDCDESGLGAG